MTRRPTNCNRTTLLVHGDRRRTAQISVVADVISTDEEEEVEGDSLGGAGQRSRVSVACQRRC